MDYSQLKPRSPYKRGADWGALFGIYLSALFFASSYSFDYPICSVLAFVMMIGVPLFVAFVLRYSYVQDRGTTIFSSLWVEGIAIFFFGGLISSLVAFVYMRWLEPDFIADRLNAMIDVYSSAEVPNGKDVVEVLQAVRDRELLPRPIEIIVDMLWLIVFTGSILSMIISMLVPLKKVKNTDTTSNNNLNNKN
jgi:hypothetical protein